LPTDRDRFLQSFKGYFHAYLIAALRLSAINFHKPPEQFTAIDGFEWDEVWRVRVLEFVLERRCFYSSFANFDNIAKDAVFLS
jgi:hypothetical protein